MADKKCIACRKDDASYCSSCYQKKGRCNLKRKDFRLIQRLVEKIFEFYPSAVITGFYLAGNKCIIHFRALGRYGSDSVHVKSNGEVWQTMSGDLNLLRLEELEDALRHIINPIPNLATLFK